MVSQAGPVPARSPGTAPPSPQGTGVWVLHPSEPDHGKCILDGKTCLEEGGHLSHILPVFKSVELVIVHIVRGVTLAKFSTPGRFTNRRLSRAPAAGSTELLCPGRALFMGLQGQGMSRSCFCVSPSQTLGFPSIT